MKEHLVLNIKELALLKSNPQLYHRKYIVDSKSYSHKPHLGSLPHDRRTNDPDLLQERIDACDEKIKQTEKEIKEMEEALNYDKKIYVQANIDELLDCCKEFIDGKYSEKALLEAADRDRMFGKTQYDILIDSIKSIHPDFEANGKNHPLDIENISDWYNDRGFGEKHKELQWINGMLTRFDHDGGGTSGPAGVDMVPWTRFLRREAERTENPLIIEARDHAHKTSRLADKTSTVLWKASTKYVDTNYTEKDIEKEKTILQDYKDERQRTLDKKEEVSKKEES